MQLGNAIIFAVFGIQGGQCRFKRRHGIRNQRLQRFVEDQQHKIIGRVIAARIFTREDIGTNIDRAIFVTGQFKFQQAFID